MNKIAGYPSALARSSTACIKAFPSPCSRTSGCTDKAPTASAVV